MRTIKESCLDRIILFGEGALRTAISEFLLHYLKERNHQGLTNESSIRKGALAVARARSSGGSAWVGCSITITARHERRKPSSHGWHPARDADR